MHPVKVNRNTDTRGSINTCNMQRYTSVLLVVILNIFISASFASVTKTTSLPATTIASSLPLWGGGQILAANQPKANNQIKLHHFDNLQCGTCHDYTPTEENINSTSKNVWKTGVDINKSCTLSGCHTYEESMNHPIGVTVKGIIPESMQTDSFSRITCITCHENAQTAPDDAESTEGITSERFLQTPNSQQLCASCHASAGSVGSRSHWRFSNKAHLNPIKTGDSFAQSNTIQLFASVDDESNNCLSCHDEVSAVIPAMNETSAQKSNRFKSMSDHPIGMNFSHKANTIRGGFISPMKNSNSIRLFEGRVGCGSCHSLYSKNEFYLSVNNSNGELCRSCHNK